MRRGAGPRKSRSRLLLCLLGGLVAACGGQDPAEDTQDRSVGQLMVLVPEQPDSGLAIAAEEVAGLLVRAGTFPVTVVTGTPKTGWPARAFLVALGPNAVTDHLIPDAERRTLKDNGYILRTGTFEGIQVLAGAGKDALEGGGADKLGSQYAAYEILRAFGFEFFHPKQPYLPASVSLPAGPIDQVYEPDYRMRGIHIHTMHPLPYMFTFLDVADLPDGVAMDNLAECKRYVDWLVSNRQNYFQWALLDTIPVDAWIGFAREIVAYAHDRGVQVGIDAPLQFIQQNAFALAPVPALPWKPQVDFNLRRLMQVDWDYLNVEMGSAEAIPVSDTQTVEMLDYVGAKLWDEYGRTRLTVKVHCTTGQKAPHFGDINFNFIPQFCSERVGVLPHSVQFYDLYGPAPTYGNQDFHELRGFLLEQAALGTREVIYYPESAYWITFDNSVPLFLPVYVQARWNDLHGLRESGMAGQLNFETGWEWGYWLNTWASASFAFEAGGDWASQIQRFTRIFGGAAAALQELMVGIVEEQRSDLLEKNLIAYLIGHNAATDFGDRVADTFFMPRRVDFRDIWKMGAAELAAFEAGILPGLGDLEQAYGEFVQAAEAAGADVPPRARPWYEEIRNAVQVMAYRTQMVRRLYEGTVRVRKEELGLDPEGKARAAVLFAEARTCTDAARTVVARQEALYRWPVELLVAGNFTNPTAYPYGYLYTTRDLFYWEREIAQAVDRADCMCLMNIDEMIESLVGRGIVNDIAKLIPPWLLGPCLDVCMRPVFPPVAGAPELLDSSALADAAVPVP